MPLSSALLMSRNARSSIGSAPSIGIYRLRTIADIGPQFAHAQPILGGRRGFPACACEAEPNAALHQQSDPLAPPGRRLATPEPIKDWSLSSLKEKLIKIGAKVISHGRSIAFQMAEVAVPRQMFREILRLIAELRPTPSPAPA